MVTKHNPKSHFARVVALVLALPCCQSAQAGDLNFTTLENGYWNGDLICLGADQCSLRVPWEGESPILWSNSLATRTADDLWGLRKLADGHKVEVCVHVDGKVQRCEPLKCGGVRP